MKKRILSPVLHWWSFCPALHTISAASLGVLCAFWLVRRHPKMVEWLLQHFVTPLQRGISGFCAHLPFSVAELTWVLLAVAVFAGLVWFGVGLFRAQDRWLLCYRAFAAAAAMILAIYAGFCLLWGVYYYGTSFEEKSGLKAQPVSAQQLYNATAYFIDGMNRTAQAVPRDANGCADFDTAVLLTASDSIYEKLTEEFPFLAAPVRRPKPVFVSRALSAFHFTGFFFPFTGEANINTDFPDALRPAVIAHEMAHQRAIAPEQEANFVGIQAAITSGNPIYAYSGYLQGYIYLANALLQADPDGWQQLMPTICAEANADLIANNTYWAKYSTPVSETAQNVYDGFLKSYDQPLGRKSYGACIDLLCAYYFPESA